MLLAVILLIAGLALIVKGGDAFVDAAAWAAEKTGIPKLIIGATVVSLATTLPEMLVSFLAAGQGKVDMAVGNAVGSVMANTGLVMGIALFCMPAAIRRKDYLLKSVLMLGAAGVLVLCGFAGRAGLLPSLLLLVIFAAALFDNLRTARAGMAGGRAKKQGAVVPAGRPQEPGAPAPRAARQTAANILRFVLGAAAIVAGSRLLVDNGSALALLLGVPERVIALSVMAVGTSLPELVTTVAAIAKKQSALSAGNIIGANIIDLTLILPISSLIAGRALPIASQFATVDLPVCFAIGCLALIPSLVTRKFHRAQGAAMAGCHLVYLLFTTLGQIAL